MNIKEKIFYNRRTLKVIDGTRLAKLSKLPFYRTRRQYMLDWIHVDPKTAKLPRRAQRAMNRLVTKLYLRGA